MDINLIVHSKLLNMKNKDLLILFLLAFLAASFLGCSKENPATENQATSAVLNSNNDVTNNTSRFAPRHYGSIIGVLIPVPAKARIVAFNDQYVSEETTSNQDGSFELKNLPGASYRVTIDYVPIGANSYSSLTIERVVVIAGGITNLGIINLQ